MLNLFRQFPAALRRGLALVLAHACLLVTFAPASAAVVAAAPAQVTAVRAVTEGAATRIQIAGNAPLAYGVRRAAARTLLVELPDADASRLPAAYKLTSPLASTVSVECASGAHGRPVARLHVALLAPVRERAYISGRDLVVELTPEQEPTTATQTPATAQPPVAEQARADVPVVAPVAYSDMTASVAQQPTPRPTPSATQSRPAGQPQSEQGKRYGEYGFMGEPINLNVVNADVRDILNYITEQYGVNFIIDKSVGAVPVTVNVTDVPWNIALDAILRANRLGIAVEGNILRVATIEVLAEEAAAQAAIQEARLNAAPLVTEFVRLNYARAVGTLAQAAGSTGGFAGGASNESFSGGAGGDATGKSGDQGILPIVKRRLSKRGAVEVDGRSNTLIITDVRENIESIRQLVALLDQPEPQVEIEARIVVANRSFSRDLGVQLNAITVGTNRGSVANFATLPNQERAGTTGGTVPDAGPRRTGVPFGLPGTNPPSGTLGATAANTVIGLTTGLIGTAQISALITLAESKGQAKIVATPRVTALNNRPAQIESGQQIPVVTPQAGGGTGTSANVVFTTTFVSVPLRLSITPQISDAGTVVLRVVAENNSVNTSLTNSLGTPGIDTQRMQTEVLVPDGGTTVVGGVLADNESNTQDRTPGLSGIPVLGNLFKRRGTTRSTNELLFFITPRIYRPDFQGRPTSGTVTDRTRTVSIPQPVPLGNPQSNTPPQIGVPEQTPQPQPLTRPTTTPTPTPARPDATTGDRPQGGN
jgi:type IV pilus assembly protein PilQ